MAGYPEPVYVVYPSLHTNWKVEAVPVSAEMIESRKRFPKEWGGKTPEELVTLTGIPDVVFSHNSGFLTSTKTKEGALAIAELALHS